MNIIFFILLCYGITMLIVQSKIVEPIRTYLGVNAFFKNLLHCMMCTGFWVGLFISGIYSPTHAYMNCNNDLLERVFDGAFTSGLVWFLYLLQLNLERHVSDNL